ncbi:hypothetical protein FA13DRAFT_297742 [Coprinellus micaceus]|uniref:Uncharacterized protein n=1 Tax=Coprinellus micaceus TaxID=71717 RepID=A0A4Y7SDX9_COPMI|nr:hypothetical protein FA13DRAFT_297742 [Coprinellus micaceus]
MKPQRPHIRRLVTEQSTRRYPSVRPTQPGSQPLPPSAAWSLTPSNYHMPVHLRNENHPQLHPVPFQPSPVPPQRRRIPGASKRQMKTNPRTVSMTLRSRPLNTRMGSQGRSDLNRVRHQLLSTPRSPEDTLPYSRPRPRPTQGLSASAPPPPSQDWC